MPTEKPTPAPVRNYDFLPGVLSFLVPGLGQIYQGRVAKGLLFLVCIYTLFFYGMALDNWKNVYLPRATRFPESPLSLKIGGVPIALPKPLGYRVQYLGQFWVGVVAWPALYQHWNYEDEDQAADPIFGHFQRTPSESELNELQMAGDKTWDLGWIYTVIAGVLNVMVIYDAIAGPAYILPAAAAARKEAA